MILCPNHHRIIYDAKYESNLSPKTYDVWVSKQSGAEHYAEQVFARGGKGKG